MRARRGSARCWHATNVCAACPSLWPSCQAWRAPSRRQAISAPCRRCGRTAAGSTGFTSRASHCLDPVDFGPVDFDGQMKANPANNNTLEEPRMTLPRRRLLAATAATALAAPWIGGTARAQAKQLKISHQFPGGTADSGDFRDQMCRRFAAELAKRTNGALTAEVYPGSSLVKTVAQYSAIRRGALDMTLYPLNYAGGEVSEYNIGFMPGVISSLDQAYAWKKAEIGKRLTALMAEKGAVPVIWLWQAGGSANPHPSHPVAQRRHGPEGARRQPRDVPDAEGCRCRRGQHAVQRALRRHANRHDGRRHDLLDQPDVVPPGRDRQKPDDRSRQGLLLHLRAAADVQADFRLAAQGPADRDHGGRPGNGEVRSREVQGRRRHRRQGL